MIISEAKLKAIALARQAGGFRAPPRREPVVIGFEANSDGVVVQLLPRTVVRIAGLYLDALPGGQLRALVLGTEHFTQGDPIPATAFGWRPQTASATVLRCAECGAPLEPDPDRPVTICAHCRAPSVVAFPGDVPPTFVRDFCGKLPTWSPGVLLRLDLSGVRGGFVWGETICH